MTHPASYYLDRIERAEDALPSARAQAAPFDAALRRAINSGDPVAEARALEAYNRKQNRVLDLLRDLDYCRDGLRAAERLAADRADMEASVVVGGGRD